MATTTNEHLAVGTEANFSYTGTGRGLQRTLLISGPIIATTEKAVQVNDLMHGKVWVPTKALYEFEYDEILEQIMADIRYWFVKTF